MVEERVVSDLIRSGFGMLFQHVESFDGFLMEAILQKELNHHVEGKCCQTCSPFRLLITFRNESIIARKPIHFFEHLSKAQKLSFLMVYSESHSPNFFRHKLTF